MIIVLFFIMSKLLILINPQLIQNSRTQLTVLNINLIVLDFAHTSILIIILTNTDIDCRHIIQLLYHELDIFYDFGYHIIMTRTYRLRYLLPHALLLPVNVCTCEHRIHIHTFTMSVSHIHTLKASSFAL